MIKLYRDEFSRKAGFSFENLSGPNLSVIKKNFPDDYQKLLRLYPYAEAGVLRFEKFGEGKGRKMEKQDG